MSKIRVLVVEDSLFFRELLVKHLNRHPEIEEFRFMCVKLFDQNAHVLDAKSEELLSYYSPLTSAGSELYSSLAVADGKGEKITLSRNQSYSRTIIRENNNW